MCRAAGVGSRGANMGKGIWSDLLFTVLALAFVLVLAWLFLVALKRFTGGRAASRNTPLHIVQALPLGGRERLLVVRYGTQEYLLGVTTHSVHTIDKCSPPATPTATDASGVNLTDVIDGSR